MHIESQNTTKSAVLNPSSKDQTKTFNHPHSPCHFSSMWTGGLIPYPSPPRVNAGWSSTSIIIPVCNKNTMKALMLARICSSVDLLHRRDTFRASLVLQQRVLNHPNIRAPRAWKMGKVTKRWNKWPWKGEISEVGSCFNDLFMTIHPTHNNNILLYYELWWYIYKFQIPLSIRHSAIHVPTLQRKPIHKCSVFRGQMDARLNPGWMIGVFGCDSLLWFPLPHMSHLNLFRSRYDSIQFLKLERSWSYYRDYLIHF